MGDCSVVGHDPGVVLESASALHPPRECEPAVTFTELRSGDRHGPLGSSIGWAILMSSIVLDPFCEGDLSVTRAIFRLARFTAKWRILGCPNIRWAGVMFTSIEPAAF